VSKLRAALVFALALATTTPSTPQSPSLLLRKPAPAFTRTDLNGRRVRLRDYRGKVVLLNFWATWCAPCLQELPRFSDWQTRYGTAGLQILAVSMDDSDAPVRTLEQNFRPTFPVVMGDARLGTRFGGVLGLPITYLIDRKGLVIARLEGATDLDALELQIHSLLDQR
jgi:cytochrome c biogenesis protein CcmG, thiol:disulfide interchange protein DsbE